MDAEVGGEEPDCTVAELSHTLPQQLQLTLVSVLDPLYLGWSAVLPLCSDILNGCLTGKGLLPTPYPDAEAGVLLPGDHEDLTSLVTCHRSP